MTRSSCHDTQRNILTPLPDDFHGKTPKRRLPRGELPDLRGFRHFFVYIAHFPQKSKLYGEIKWYFRHAKSLNLGQVVNTAETTGRRVAGSAQKRRDKSVSGAGIRGEIFFLARHPFPGLGVGW